MTSRYHDVLVIMCSWLYACDLSQNEVRRYITGSYMHRLVYESRILSMFHDPRWYSYVLVADAANTLTYIPSGKHIGKTLSCRKLPVHIPSYLVTYLD